MTLNKKLNAYWFVTQSALRPSSLIDYIGLIFGMPSVIELLNVAFKIPLADVLKSILRSYETVLSFITYPIGLVAHWVIATLFPSMTLPDYWRHLFVLVLLYVLRHASNIAAEARKTDDHAFSKRLWTTMALQLFVGLVIATGLAFGMALLVGTQPGLFTQIVFIGSFCLALLAYDAVYVYWHANKLILFYNRKFNKHQSPAEYIDERMSDALNRTVLAFLSGATCFVILELQNFPRAFVPASVASLSTVGLVWIAKAGQITSKMAQRKELDSTKLGGAVLRPILYGTIFAIGQAKLV